MTSRSMHLQFNGKMGTLPEYGSEEHMFLLACTQEEPELWNHFSGYPESDIKSIVQTLQFLGWGFAFVTLH